MLEQVAAVYKGKDDDNQEHRGNRFGLIYIGFRNREKKTGRRRNRTDKEPK